MKIDLHTHSMLSKKNGDGIKMESLFYAIAKFKKLKVRVAAFSDHNNFEVDFYLQAKQIASEAKILLLPAVEIDVVRNNDQTGNIIVIFPDTLLHEEYQNIEQIIKQHMGKRKNRIATIFKILQNQEKIVIPHVGKSDFCSYEDLAKIKYDAIEITNYKHSNFINFQKQLKINNQQTSIVAFSDTHIWTSYPQNKRLYTYIKDIHSYHDLKQSLSKNQNYIKEY